MRNERHLSLEVRAAQLAYAIVREKPLDTVEHPYTLKGFEVEKVGTFLRKAYYFPKTKGASGRYSERVAVAQAWYDQIVTNNKAVEAEALRAKVQVEEEIEQEQQVHVTVTG